MTSATAAQPRRQWFRRRGDILWTASWIVGGYLAALLAGILFAQLMRRTGNWDQGLPWERAFLLRTHVRLPEAIDTLFLVLPWLGTNITLIPLVAAVSVWLLVKRKRPDLAAHLITVQLGSFTLNPVLKAIFDRPRPDLFEMRGQFAWAAFPSGHAIASVSVLLTAAILLRRERGWRWPMPVAIVLLLTYVAGLSFSLRTRSDLAAAHELVPVAAGGGVISLLPGWLGATSVAWCVPRPAGAPERVRLEPARPAASPAGTTSSAARLQAMHDLLPTPPGRPRRSTAIARLTCAAAAGPPRFASYITPWTEDRCASPEYGEIGLL